MKTEHLIELLSQNLPRKETLPSPIYRFSLWFFISLLYVTGIILLHSVTIGSIHFPNSIISQSFLFLILLTSSWFLYKWNIPELKNQIVYFLLFGSFTAWVLFKLSLLFLEPSPSFSIEGDPFSIKEALCTLKIILVSLLPTILLLRQLRKGYFDGSLHYILLTGILSMSLGEYAISFICPNETSGHVFFWHIVPGFFVFPWVPYFFSKTFRND